LIVTRDRGRALCTRWGESSELRNRWLRFRLLAVAPLTQSRYVVLSGVTVVIRSSGTEPVQFNLDSGAHDTETPVTIDFGPETRILGEPAVDPEPKTLKVSAIKDPENPTTVVLDKFLLNPGQSVTVSTFADNLRGSPRVYGNIAGVRLRERTGERRRWISADPTISDIGSWILDPVIPPVIGTIIGAVMVALFLFFVVVVWLLFPGGL
jgi:hypothetical protein